MTKTWTTVTTSAELSAEYRDHGWWDGRSMPALLADALDASAARRFQVHSLDRPARVLDLMIEDSLSAGTGAPLFLASLLDDPRCMPAHHQLIESSSLGGAAVTPELVRRADLLGITAMRGYGCTEHPSISLGHVTHSLA